MTSSSELSETEKGNFLVIKCDECNPISVDGSLCGGSFPLHMPHHMRYKDRYTKRNQNKWSCKNNNTTQNTNGRKTVIIAGFLYWQSIFVSQRSRNELFSRLFYTASALMLILFCPVHAHHANSVSMICGNKKTWFENNENFIQ